MSFYFLVIHSELYDVLTCSPVLDTWIRWDHELKLPGILIRVLSDIISTCIELHLFCIFTFLASNIVTFKESIDHKKSKNIFLTQMSSTTYIVLPKRYIVGNFQKAINCKICFYVWRRIYNSLNFDIHLHLWTGVYS